MPSSISDLKNLPIFNAVERDDAAGAPDPDKLDCGEYSLRVKIKKKNWGFQYLPRLTKAVVAWEIVAAIRFGFEAQPADFVPVRTMGARFMGHRLPQSHLQH